MNRLRVLLDHAPRGIDRLVLVFSGPQKIQKTLETSPGATPSEVSFDLPRGLYALVAWFHIGNEVYLSDKPVSVQLPEQGEVRLDLAQVHPDNLGASNL